MIITIYTPVDQGSAIARLTSSIVIELRELGHDVTIISTEHNGVSEYVSDAISDKCVSWRDYKSVSKICDISDICIYNIGDDYKNHAGSLHWIETYPGIVVMHDFYLDNLFNGWSTCGKMGAEKIASVSSHYKDGYSCKSQTEAENSTEFHRCSPVTVWLSNNAKGIILHDELGLNSVASLCSGPVCIFNFDHDMPESLTPTPSSGSDDGILKIISIENQGRIANKDAEDIVEFIKMVNSADAISSGLQVIIDAALKYNQRSTICQNDVFLDCLKIFEG